MEPAHQAPQAKIEGLLAEVHSQMSPPYQKRVTANAGMLLGAIIGIAGIVDGIEHLAAAAAGHYKRAHANGDADVTSSLVWLREDLQRLAAYVADVQRRAAL